MVKKKERLASIVFVALLYLFLLSAGFDAYAQQIPNRDELKATYCIAHLRSTQILAAQQLSNTGSSSDLRKEMNNELARLDAFLAGRIKYLNPDSLKAAAEGAAEDTVEVFLEIQSCLRHCRKDAECSRNCVEDSNSAAGLRLAKCNDLSFLPF